MYKYIVDWNDNRQVAAGPRLGTRARIDNKPAHRNGREKNFINSSFYLT